MPNAKGFDPKDVVTDGLSVAAELLGDRSVVQQFMSVYPDVAQEVDSMLRPGDAASIAIACINNDSAVQQVSVLILLSDRAILSWSKGLFRPKISTAVMELTSVRSAVIVPGSGGSKPGRVLTVTGSTTWELALFSDKPAFTEFVRSRFYA